MHLTCISNLGWLFKSFTFVSWNFLSKICSFMLLFIKVLDTCFRFLESHRNRIGFKAQISFLCYITSLQHTESREVTFSCHLKENCSHFMKSSFLKVHTLRIICHLRYRMTLKNPKMFNISWHCWMAILWASNECNISQCKKLHKIFQYYFA